MESSQWENWNYLLCRKVSSILLIKSLLTAYAIYFCNKIITCFWEFKMFWYCEFDSRSGWGVPNSVIKFVSDLRQFGGYLRVLRFPPIKLTATICICYLEVNWLIPKISACRARIWSLLASERSERVTNFIFCRAGWYFSVSIIFTDTIICQFRCSY